MRGSLRPIMMFLLLSTLLAAHTALRALSPLPLAGLVHTVEAAAPAIPSDPASTPAPASPKPAGSQPAAPQAAAAQERGEVVDMAFQKAEVADVFQVLGELAGLNVLVDPSATGQVTFLLHRIPVMEAIDLVARATGFGYKVVGRTLIVAAPQRLQEQFARDVVATVLIRYLTAADAGRLVQIVAPDVQTAVDPRSSSIVMRGAEEDVERAKEFLARHDVAITPELRFDSAPLGSVLLTLAQAGGMSLVARGELTGTVTLYLRPGTPVADALAIVAAETGIGYEITPANVLVVTLPNANAGAAQSQASLGVQARAHTLYFVPAETAQELLAAALPEVTAQGVPGSNVLLLQGTPARLQQAQELLRSFDRPAVRVVGVLQLGNEVRALIEIGGNSYVVRTGSQIGPLTVTAVTKQAVTLELDGQAIVAPAGGAPW